MNCKVKSKTLWADLENLNRYKKLICMFKSRYHSAHSNFKTGILCKLTLFFGIVFTILFIVSKAFGFIISSDASGFTKQMYDFSQSTIPESLLAFGLIFLAVSVILYYLNCQFAKLSQIADEIEKGEEFKQSD